MATCKYDPGVNSSNPYAILTVTEKSYSVEDNTSVVSWNLKLYRPYSISSSADKDYSVKINGSTVKSSTTTIGGSGTKTIASGTKTINHNSDGSKTISFSFSLEFAITWSGTYIGTGSASGSLKLTTIPRATTPTVSDESVNFGESVTITMSRASSSFTHTLKYTFGGSTATIGSSLGTSKAWTVPLSLMDKIPSATSGTLTFTCETYNGSTKIGSKTVDITVKVPSTVIPTASLTVAENVTKVADVFGVFVKGLSKLSITAKGTGAYSSTIKSYKITANDETFTTSSATTGVLKSSGSLTIKVTVTDSRGRTGSESKTITVYNYSKPVINIFEGVRSNADGTENDEGANVLLTLKGSVTNLTGNTATYKVSYKKSSANSYTNKTLDVSTLSIDQTYILANIDTEESYDIKFTITDAYGNSSYIVIQISTAFTLVDYHSSGKGMSIGKVAELEGVLDIGLPVKFSGGMYSESRILWSGAYYMNASQTITLSKKVSEQLHGIVLVFSRYSNSTAQNYHFNSFFVPKEVVALQGGNGHSFIMTTSNNFDVIAMKYLYIHDDKIGGNDNNVATGTGATGITYANNGFVLRYVIGV